MSSNSDSVQSSSAAAGRRSSDPASASVAGLAKARPSRWTGWTIAGVTAGLTMACSLANVCATRGPCSACGACLPMLPAVLGGLVLALGRRRP
jgi:hypothetical protein